MRLNLFMKSNIPYPCLLGIISYAFSGVSYADTDPHFYLGGRIGKTIYQNTCRASTSHCDSEASGLGLYGGYQLNDWLAFEGGVTSYGRFENHLAAIEADIYGSELLTKLSIPLTEHFLFFTRLGGTWQHVVTNGSEMRKSTSFNEWNVLSSVGASYRFSQHWSLRGEYQFTNDFSERSSYNADQHFSSIGVTYHFAAEKPSFQIEVTRSNNDTEKPPYELIKQKKISFMTESLFSFDSAELTINEALESLVEQLHHHPASSVHIVGHTDSIGTKSYNQRLSERRAESVAIYLQHKGISESRISIKGMGESSPITTNNTAEGRAKNRRVEVIFN